MPPLCGQSPSIQPLTPAKMPITMSPAPPHLHQLSPMALKILTLELPLPIYTENVQEHTREHQLLHQKLLEYSHLLL